MCVQKLYHCQIFHDLHNELCDSNGIMTHSLRNVDLKWFWLLAFFNHGLFLVLHLKKDEWCPISLLLHKDCDRIIMLNKNLVPNQVNMYIAYNWGIWGLGKGRTQLEIRKLPLHPFAFNTDFSLRLALVIYRYLTRRENCVNLGDKHIDLSCGKLIIWHLSSWSSLDLVNVYCASVIACWRLHRHCLYFTSHFVTCSR